MSAGGGRGGSGGGGGLTNSSSSRGVTMIPCRRRRGELHLRKDTLTLCFLQSSYQEASECRVKDGSSLESHTHTLNYQHCLLHFNIILFIKDWSMCVCVCGVFVC